MNEFFKFASENPFLTFFLFCIVTEMIVRIFYAVFHYTESKDEDEDDE